MNIPRPMGVHSQILVNDSTRRVQIDKSSKRSDQLNVIENLQSKRSSPRWTSSRVQWEFILKRQYLLKTTKRLFPTGSFEKRDNHHALSALPSKSEASSMFFKWKRKANAKAIWVCKRPILFYLLWLSLPPLVRENEEWNVKVPFLEKGPLVPRILRKSAQLPLCSCVIFHRRNKVWMKQFNVLRKAYFVSPMQAIRSEVINVKVWERPFWWRVSREKRMAPNRWDKRLSFQPVFLECC